MGIKRNWSKTNKRKKQLNKCKNNEAWGKLSKEEIFATGFNSGWERAIKWINQLAEEDLLEEKRKEYFLDELNAEEILK